MIDYDLTRARLVGMRTTLLANLEERIEGGYLALLADVNSAIAAIDLERVGGPYTSESSDPLSSTGKAVSPISTSPQRAVTRDDGGKAIELQIFAEAELVATVPISAHRAIDLAAELIEAARRRL